MKKTPILLILSVIVMAGKAQKLSIVPSAGFGQTWTRYINYEKYSRLKPKSHPLSHYTFGAELVYNKGKHLVLSTGIHFSIEGGEHSNFSFPVPNSETAIIRERPNYIRIPVQAGYIFGKPQSKIRPVIAAGPSFGILGPGGHYKSFLNGVASGERTAHDMFRNFDIGVQGTAGVNFRVGKNTWINTGISFYNGFYDLYTHKRLTDESVVNQNFAINAGLVIPLK